MNQFHLPIQVDYIIRQLKDSGFQAYPVGGCVRDLVMKRKPNDWDIATNALPETIKKIFFANQLIVDYEQHGTISVILDKKKYEITTFRLESSYSDHRHPDQVSFSDSLIADLSRRDFTMNALALDHNEIIDYFGGLNDIQNKIIRCVGDPVSRFREDALRIMRALRFSSVFSFDIDRTTAKAANSNKLLIKEISSERVSSEFMLIMKGTDVAKVLSDYADIIFTIIPELNQLNGFDQNNPHHIYNIWEHTLCAIQNSPDDLLVRTALLLHDIGKPYCYTEDSSRIGHFYGHPDISASIADEILKRLHFRKNDINQIVQLIRYHDTAILPNRISIKKLLSNIGESNLKKLLLIKSADIHAQSPKYFSANMDNIKKIESVFQQIVQEKSCYSMKQLAINGDDLIKSGIKEGSKLGFILNTLLNLVIEEDLPNRKFDLIQKAIELNQHIKDETK